MSKGGGGSGKGGAGTKGSAKSQLQALDDAQALNDDMALLEKLKNELKQLDDDFDKKVKDAEDEFTKEIDKLKNDIKNGGHDVLPDDPQSAIKKIQEITGMSEKDAIESARAVNSFTNYNYDEIRKLEYAGKTSAQIDAINRYIDKMPKFQGEISRGKEFDSPEKAQAFIDKMKKGAPYVLPAMSSFTSDPDVAKRFANIEKNAGVEGSTPMVFVVAANKRGVSVRSLASTGMKDEDEVLVPKKTKYKLKGEPYLKNGTWYVPLEEG